MDFDSLLAQIWGETITLDEEQSPSGLAALLTTMVNVPVVELVCATQIERPFAYMESVELMESVTLGDILAEELEIEVPYGAMILLSPVDFFKDRAFSSGALGELVGLALLDIAFPNAPTRFGARPGDESDVGNPIVALNDFAQNWASRIQ